MCFVVKVPSVCISIWLNMYPLTETKDIGDTLFSFLCLITLFCSVVVLYFVWLLLFLFFLSDKIFQKKKKM